MARWTEGWIADARSVCGASHASGEKPCQDASFVLVEEDAIFAAVADGHGSEAHFRSGLGAELACRAAEYVLKRADLNGLNDQKAEALCQEILNEWQSRVSASVREYAFTEEENRIFRSFADKRNAVERVYGTTLIAMIIRPDAFLALRCGDGECVIVDADGRMTEPIALHEACHDHVTVSMCDLSTESFRWYFDRTPPAAGILVSDGLSNNAVDAGGLRGWIERKLFAFSQYGGDWMTAGIWSDLENISAMGYGDDVSAAFAVNRAAVNRLADELSGKIAMERAARELQAKKKRKAVLKADIRWAEQAIERKNRKYEELRAKGSGGGSESDKDLLTLLVGEIENTEKMLRESRAALDELLREEQQTENPDQ